MPISSSQRTHETSGQKWLDLLMLNDCEPEESLDYLTRDAATIFKVPIAMINLASSEYIIFKSCIGLPQATKLDRSGAFCATAVLQEEPLIIENTLSDEVFRTSPLVIGPLKIRSYIGKSLHAADGSRIGTICLLDTKPRSYSKSQVRALCDMALQAEEQLAMILKFSSLLDA
jgi:GAF domain-containing protein